MSIVGAVFELFLLYKEAGTFVDKYISVSPSRSNFFPALLVKGGVDNIEEDEGDKSLYCLG
jgi:hypothetical protein